MIRHILGISLGIFIAIEMCVVGLWATPINAQADCGDTYTVRFGDTLYKIAKKCDITFAELRAANPQITDPNIIRVGQVLIVPSGQDAHTDTDTDTANLLRNSTYQTWYTESGQAQLTDGQFRAEVEHGTVGIQLLDPIALGDLNGDGIMDAAVILLSQLDGTTGRFRSLHAMLGDGHGFVDAGSLGLGDRNHINDLVIQPDGEILVDTVALGPDDALMGPSVPVVYSFLLTEEGLLLTAFRAPTCDQGVDSRLMWGMEAEVLPGDANTLWSDWQPSADRTRIRQLQPGTRLTVRGGPHCRDGYTWWHVETQNGQRGWTAEGKQGLGYFLAPVAPSTSTGNLSYFKTILPSGVWPLPHAGHEEFAVLEPELIIEPFTDGDENTYLLVYTKGWLGEGDGDYAPSISIWGAVDSGFELLTTISSDWYTKYHGDYAEGRYILDRAELTRLDGELFLTVYGFINDPTTMTVDFIYFSEFGPWHDFGLSHGIGGEIKGEIHTIAPGRYGYVVVRRFRTAPADTGAEIYLYSPETDEYEPALTLDEFGHYDFEFIPDTGEHIYDVIVTVTDPDADDAMTFKQRYRYVDGAYVGANAIPQTFVPGVVHMYSAEGGGGSGEQLLRLSDNLLTCAELVNDGPELISGERFYLYGEGWIPLPNPERYLLHPLADSDEDEVDYAILLDEAEQTCPEALIGG